MILLLVLIAVGALAALIIGVCLLVPRCERRPGFITERRRP